MIENGFLISRNDLYEVAGSSAEVCCDECSKHCVFFMDVDQPQWWHMLAEGRSRGREVRMPSQL